MYISSAVPNKQPLGAANGLALTVASIQGMVGPAVVDWLFAFTLTNNILGGKIAYMILVNFSWRLSVLCGPASIEKNIWTHSSI